MKPNWKNVLENRLKLYGHRNWLVVADAAYPAQSRQAIETIVADEEQATVLQYVLGLVRDCKHIKPNVYMDEELKFVREEEAPGVDAYRKKLGELVKRGELRVLPHEEIIATLDRVGEKFRVLLIKTNMRIPYTSVFLELECGYWNPEAEKRLRAAMQSANGKRHSRAMATR
jgi:L-fucose mutarotase/ribose pyranase (RbsD/FucU family)